MAWLNQQRERWLSRLVTYRRGGLSLAVAATVGRTVFRLDVGPGVTERSEARDYLISAPLVAALQQPQRGDQVIEEDATTRSTYEVMAPGREPVWRWTDADRRCYRIHTKLVKTETL